MLNVNSIKCTSHYLYELSWNYAVSVYLINNIYYVVTRNSLGQFNKIGVDNSLTVLNLHSRLVRIIKTFAEWNEQNFEEDGGSCNQMILSRSGNPDIQNEHQC